MTKNQLQKFKFKNQGQAMMEYMIISFLVGIICLGAMKTFGKRIKTRVDQMTQQIESIKL